MSKLMFLVILIVACASMSFAQSTSDYNKVEFFGGFSHNRVDTGIDDSDDDLGDIISESEGFNGFNASVTGNITRYFGLKADVSGHFKKKDFPVAGFGTVSFDSSIFNFLGGVQVKDNSKEARFKPFAHALVGAARVRTEVNFSNGFCTAILPSPCPADTSESQTGLAGAFGGGLDFRVSDRVDIRAIQLDYNPTRIDGTTQHNFRVGVGIVFH
jgi:opacity protein-like surface antigen